MEHNISKAVIGRLPRYYRYLGDLIDADIERISSGELSRIMQVTASQIRQDLNNFGGFGQQGYGYNVRYLYEEIGKILGLDKTYQMLIIGAGNLGQALANYVQFEKKGMYIAGLFDNNPRLKGTLIRDIPVRMMEELPAFLAENHIDIVALTLPKAGAIAACQILMENGVKSFWNFAHTDLEVPEDVVVQNVHLSDSLMELTYKINHR